MPSVPLFTVYEWGMEEGEFSQAPMRTWLAALEQDYEEVGADSGGGEDESNNLSAAILHSIIPGPSCFCSGSCPLWP